MFRPIAARWARDVLPSANLGETTVTEAIILGQSRHRCRPHRAIKALARYRCWVCWTGHWRGLRRLVTRRCLSLWCPNISYPRFCPNMFPLAPNLLLLRTQHQRLNTSRRRLRQGRLLDRLAELFPHPMPGRRFWNIGTPQQCAQNSHGNSEFGGQMLHRFRPREVVELLACKAMFYGDQTFSYVGSWLTKVSSTRLEQNKNTL